MTVVAHDNSTTSRVPVWFIQNSDMHIDTFCLYLILKKLYCLLAALCFAISFSVIAGKS